MVHEPSLLFGLDSYWKSNQRREQVKWVEDGISAFQIRGQHAFQVPLDLAA